MADIITALIVLRVECQMRQSFAEASAMHELESFAFSLVAFAARWVCCYQVMTGSDGPRP